MWKDLLNCISVPVTSIGCSRDIKILIHITCFAVRLLSTLSQQLSQTLNIKYSMLCEKLPGKYVKMYLSLPFCQHLHSLFCVDDMYRIRYWG